MSTFDYDTNNYSVSELKDIIGIPLNEPMTYHVIHDAVTKRINTAANNKQMFRFFIQIKDRLTRIMMAGDDGESEGNYDSEHDGESEDNDESEGEIIQNILHNSIIENQRPSPPTIHAQINDGVPFGNMNPLDRTTVSKVVCVDSVFRDASDTTSAESFIVTLPDNLDRVISLSLSSINLPNTWYNVSDEPALNTFYIKTFNVYGMSADTMHTVTIPAGNYTEERMTTTLNNIFSNTNGLRLIHAMIDPVTRKTVFRAKISLDPGLPFYAFDTNAANLSPDFYYEVHFQSVVVSSDITDCDTSETAGFTSSLDHRNIGYIMGFRKPDYVVPKLPDEEDVVSFLGNSVTHYCILRSEGVFDTNIIDYIFLELDDFNNNFVTNTVVSRTQRGYIGNNILAQIPVYSTGQIQQLGMMHPGNLSTFKTRHYFGPVKIDKMAVRLLDKHGDIVNLRGNNFSFTVEVVLQYS